MKNKLALFVIVSGFLQLFSYDIQIEKHIKNLDFDELYKHIKIKNNPVNKEDLNTYLEFLKLKTTYDFFILKLTNNKLQILPSQEQSIKERDGLLAFLIGYPATVAMAVITAAALVNESLKGAIIGAGGCIAAFTCCAKGLQNLKDCGDSTRIKIILNKSYMIEALLKSSAK